MMTPNPNRALIVEDDRSWQQILSEILSDCGFRVDIASDYENAIASLKNNSHRLCLIDLSLNPEEHDNKDGLLVLAAIHRLDPNCQAVLLTGFATVEIAVKTLTEYGALNFLRKESFQRNQLLEIISKLMANAPLRNQIEMDSNFEYELNNSSPNSQSSQTELSQNKALIVEDDAGWRSILEELLMDSGYKVFISNSFGEAFGYLQRENISLTVLDLALDGKEILRYTEVQNESLDGYQLLTITDGKMIPTVIVSGVASTGEIKKAYTEHKIYAFFEKQTFDRSSFLRIIREIKASFDFQNDLKVLTSREREVLTLLSRGITNKEIAEALVITPNTVKRHVKAIFEKLKVHTRAAAAAKAISE